MGCKSSKMRSEPPAAAEGAPAAPAAAAASAAATAAPPAAAPADAAEGEYQVRVFAFMRLVTRA